MSRSALLGTLFICFLCPMPSFGQSPSPSSSLEKFIRTIPNWPPAPNRIITIQMKHGESLTGNLIILAMDNLQLEVEGQHKDIALEDIASISFVDGKQSGASTLNGPARLGLTPEQLTKAKDVFKALQSLELAIWDTREGLMYPAFHSRVIYLKAEAPKSLATIPDSPAKQALLATLQAFADLDEVWSFLNERQKPGTQAFAETNDDPMVRIARKYKIPYAAQGSFKDWPELYVKLCSDAIHPNFQWASRELSW